MKPDWKDAPDWANYLAMDSYCQWIWFEFKPKADGCIWRASGRFQYAEDPADWHKTLEAAPNEPPKTLPTIGATSNHGRA